MLSFLQNIAASGERESINKACVSYNEEEESVISAQRFLVLSAWEKLVLSFCSLYQRLSLSRFCSPSFPDEWVTIEMNVKHGTISVHERSHMILPKERDPRFITIRRGGTLTDRDHHLLASWAAACAEHVLHFFEEAQPSDPQPRHAIEQARAWVRGEITMQEARAAGGHAMGAARDLSGAARYAAYAAGQAAVVAHVAAHELGAAAYAIKAARAAAPEGEDESAGQFECLWQRDQLPDAIRDLVLDDQRQRNDICWSVFGC